MLKTRFGWIILTLAAGLLGTAWVVVSQEETLAGQALNNNSLIEAPQAGYLAPDFTLTSYLGDEITLSELRGQPTVLNFWATWCPPCRAEMPHLQNAGIRYLGRVHFIGVDQGESSELVSQFAREFGVTFPLLLDGDYVVSDKYGIRALPTTFFIDSHGVVREVFTGILNQAVLEDRLAKLMAEG